MVTFGKEWQIPIFSEEEGQRRHRHIRALMDSRDIQCLVIAGHTGNYKGQYADIRYVSNHINWFDDEYCVFPMEGEPILFVWSKGHEYWAKKVSWIPVEATQRAPSGRGYINSIVGKIKKLGLEKSTIGIVNEKTMPAYVFKGLKESLPSANLVDAAEVLAVPRLTKSAEELEFVRRAGECADIGFEAMLNAARPGVTDYELAAECEAAMIKNGAEVGSFTLFSSKQWPDGWAFPFGGTNRPLQKGDVNLNEITPCFGGYYVQLCRPISIGKPSEDFLEHYDIHHEMYWIARKALRPGNSLSDIDAKVSEFALSKRDFSFATPLLQGMDSIVSRSAAPLASNQVFMIHPWTNPPEPDLGNMKGHMGHILGDTCIVTEDEAESVSRIPFEVFTV